MKRKIVVFIAVILTLTLLTSTAAYAVGKGGPSPGQPTSQPTDEAQPSGAGQGGSEERQQFLEQVRPLLQQIARNRNQIRSMTEQLSGVREQAMEHIRTLKGDLQGLTDEQIQLMKSLCERVRECRQALGGTNPDMVKQKQWLREIRRSRNYEAILTAYGNIIRIQEERMTQLSGLIETYSQIAQI